MRLQCILHGPVYIIYRIPVHGILPQTLDHCRGPGQLVQVGPWTIITGPWVGHLRHKMVLIAACPFQTQESFWW